MNVGPNIEKEGLLFGYDTNYGVADCGLSTRFYKGRSTTNISATHHAYGHNSGNYGNDVTVVDAPEKGDGWKKVTIKDRGSNFRILQWQYTSHTSDVVYSHSAEFDWGNMREKGYSITFDGSGGGSRNYFRNGNYTSNEGSSINKSLEDGHFASNIVKSGSHVHAWFIYHYSTGVSGLNDFFYYRDYQVEVHSVSSPYTSSNRSNTDSLIDLTKSTDIDVSNVSFDSTGQPTFDGTDDVITTSFPATTIPNVTIEAVVYRNQVTNRYESIIQNNLSSDDALYINPSGYLMFWPCAPSTLTVPIGQWSHVAVSYNGTTLTYILNGTIQVLTASCSDITDWDFLRIGGHGTTDGERWIGKIAVTKVYRKSLSTEELTQSYSVYKKRFDI